MVLDNMKMTEGAKIRNGVYLSRNLAIIIMVFFLAILLTVSLLIGLLVKRTNTKEIVYMPAEENTKPMPPTATQGSTSSSALSTTTDSFGPGPWTADRLPGGIKTKHYSLYIYNIQDATGLYQGKTDIEFSLESTLPYLLFHIKYINITSFELLHEGSKIDIVRNFSYVRKQYYVLEPSSALPTGEYVLKLEYTGSSKIGIVGMYQSIYNENGVDK